MIYLLEGSDHQRRPPGMHFQELEKHEASQCHKEANEAINLLPKQVGDIGELLSKKHSDQKAENREVFLRIFQNLRFLTRQGLALRGTHAW